MNTCFQGSMIYNSPAIESVHWKKKKNEDKVVKLDSGVLLSHELEGKDGTDDSWMERMILVPGKEARERKADIARLHWQVLPNIHANELINRKLSCTT